MRTGGVSGEKRSYEIYPRNPALDGRRCTKSSFSQRELEGYAHYAETNISVWHSNGHGAFLWSVKPQSFDNSFQMLKMRP